MSDEPHNPPLLDGAGVIPIGLGLASLHQPSHVVDSAWHEHAPFASWLMAALRPSVLVELGTHNGFSFFVFCEAIVRMGLDTHAHAIDSWNGDEHAGYYAEAVFDEVSRVRSSRFSDFTTLHRGYFDDFVGAWEEASIDLLHIDGRHRYEDVLHDYSTWLPKMSDRGVVIFHDIAERRDDFGVWQLWDELSEQYPSFAFHHGHGLGVLGTGRNLPEPVIPLFHAETAQIEPIRRGYELLGSNTARLAADGRREAVMVKERDDARSELADLEARLAGVTRERNDLRSSTSWRMTSGIRAAGNLLKRRR